MAHLDMPEIKNEDQGDYLEMTEQVKVEPEVRDPISDLVSRRFFS